MTAFSLIRFTIIVRNSAPFKTELLSYFACERKGHDPNDPCDVEGFRDLSYSIMSAIALFLLGLLPAVNLVYALNIRELKQKVRGCCGGEPVSRDTTSPNGIGSTTTGTSTVNGSALLGFSSGFLSPA